MFQVHLAPQLATDNVERRLGFADGVEIRVGEIGFFARSLDKVEQCAYTTPAQEEIAEAVY